MRIIIFILGVFVHFSCFSQVSNDDCFNASPLGTLPAPANCGNGPNNDGQGDPVTFTNLTNVGAQTENPYTTLINCQGSGQDMASPATDVWYSFVPSGLSLDITINGLINDPNVALWAGNCGNLIGAGCDIGSGGSLTTTIDQLNPGDTYYLQISGGDLNDEGTFDLTLQNNVDCNACLLASTMTVDPLPVNGTYQPGTVVTFCFTVDEWNQTNTNWFQGVVPIMGSSWINLTPISSPPTCDSGPGIWDWFTGVTTPLGNSNGFFFDGAIAGFNTIPDGDPTNNFGDNCQGTGLDWEFCWQATVENCPPGQTGDDLSVNIETYGDGETGNWSDVGCNFDPVFLFSASLACCASPLVSSGDVSCQGLSDGIVTAEAQTTANPWDFEWTDDSGNVISTSNNSNSATNEVLNLAAGIYTVTVTDANGCFSSSSITITEPPIVTPIFNQIADICNGGSFSLPNISDNSVSGNWSPVNNSSSTTTYTFTPDAGECALTETMTVVVNQSSTGTDTQSACVSYLWIDGNTYSTNNNTASFNIVGGASNGCDSLVTLDLTINNTVVGVDIQTACGSYLWIDGVNYTSSNNTATFNIVDGASNGCDSLVTLDLTITSPTTGTDTQASCDTYTWIDGVDYTSSNNAATFNIVGGAENGCDSLVTLDLTINNTVVGTDIQTACGSYLWIDGVNYTSSSNAATFNIVGGASNGCDSLVTLDLTINNTVVGVDIQTACGSYLWIDGVNYTSSNNAATFNIVGGAENGCDSLVTLDLTINNLTTGTDTQAACDTYTWIDGNIYTASNNSATWLLSNAAGCDSTVTLDLTITNATTGTDTQAACDTYTWIDGNIYTASNNSATWLLSNAAGCDSIVTLDLTITIPTTGTDTQASCDNYTWINGVTYIASNNSATFLLTNAVGCDSLVTLDLTIANSLTGTDTQTACDTYTWIDGNTYTTSNNSAAFTLTASGGCDSLVTLDLTISNSSTGIDFQTACDSYTWVDGNTYTTSNNSATFLLTNTAGCDSTVTLDLIINNSVTGTDTQTACDSYLWIDGNTYDVSNNSASFNITGGGVNGCDSLVSLDLTINNTPSYTMSGTDPDICNASNGSITISGLNAGALYTISYDSLSTPSQVSNFTADTFGEYLILGLGAGLYSSFSIIHNGCEFTSPDLMDLNNPGAPSINFQLDSTVCDTYTLLDISGTNLSGNESYYTQSNAEGTPLLSGDMISSTQTIYIYDILGTCSDESSFTVTVTNTPSIINPGPQESCESFILPLSIQGNNLSGNQNYYNDSQSNGGSPINDAILSSQTVYVYDENGTCSNEVSFDITINELPMLLSFTGEGIYCDGDLIDDLLVEVSGAPDYTLDYTLNGIPLNISSSSSPLNLGNTSGAYVITSLSDNACDIILNNVQTVIVNPIPVAPDVSEDVLYCANMIPEQVLASGSSGEYTWYSDPAISQIISFGESIIPNVVLGSMTYYVTANDSDCEGLPASVTITFEECNIIIPTAFTPDNDMVNDIWELENIDNIYPNNKVFIYNRWGNQIFESEKGAYSQRPWDGRFNGNALPVASYYYIVVFNDGVTDQSIGIVSILK